MQDEASSMYGPLCVGLAHWRGYVIADTDEGQRLINREFSQWKMPLRGGPISTLHIDLLHNPLPRLRLMREGQQVDLSSFLTGPGGKRFVPTQAGQRLLYSDLALGENTPVLELCGQELHILRPDLWLFYVLHLLTWQMLTESSIAALHAAVCAVDGVALVIIGPSGSGKSTLCWALAQEGADYFSDECAYFDVSTHHLYVRSHRAGLRPGGVALLDAPPESTDWRENKPGDPKIVAQFPAPQNPCPEERSLLLFVQGFAERPCLTPLRGGEATRQITSLMGFGDPSPMARLETAADIVSHIPCLALTIGPPRETARMLVDYARSL